MRGCSALLAALLGLLAGSVNALQYPTIATTDSFSCSGPTCEFPVKASSDVSVDLRIASLPQSVSVSAANYEVDDKSSYYVISSTSNQIQNNAAELDVSSFDGSSVTARISSRANEGNSMRETLATFAKSTILSGRNGEMVKLKPNRGFMYTFDVESGTSDDGDSSPSPSAPPPSSPPPAAPPDNGDSSPSPSSPPPSSPRAPPPIFDGDSSPSPPPSPEDDSRAARRASLVAAAALLFVALL